MARFKHHEPCKKCGSRDNFGRYDDGGGFCWGCHYWEPATHAPMRNMDAEGDYEKYHHAMPDDVGHHFGQPAVEWLARFHMDVPTAIRRDVVWSPSRQQLVFQLGNVWQARNFNVPDDSGGSVLGGVPKKKFSKNFTSGDVNECTHIYQRCISSNSGDPVELSQTLVVVEDPVSAIRIAESGARCDAMPLLGSHLAGARLDAIARLYSSFVFWLDSDKLKESREMEQRAKYVGLSSRTVCTPDDPKCHTNEQLMEILK